MNVSVLLGASRAHPTVESNTVSCLATKRFWWQKVTGTCDLADEAPDPSQEASDTSQEAQYPSQDARSKLGGTRSQA